MTVTFFVEGLPIPQGSKRGFSRKGSSFVQVVDDNKATLHPWRDAITRRAFSAFAYAELLEGPVRVDAAFVLPRKPSVKRELPHVAPDLDKLLRALFDGITQAKNVWKDDSQVVAGSQSKVYGDVPGVHVTISRVTPAQVSELATVARPGMGGPALAQEG